MPDVGLAQPEWNRVPIFETTIDGKLERFPNLTLEYISFFLGYVPVRQLGYDIHV